MSSADHAQVAAAAAMVTSLSNVLGMEDSPVAIAARGQLVGLLLGTVEHIDPHAISPVSLNASLDMISALTSKPRHINGTAADDGLAYVDVLSQTVGLANVGTTAGTVSNLLDAAAGVATASTTAGNVDADVSLRRGTKISTILARVALALVPSASNASATNEVATQQFHLAGHSVTASVGANTLASAGCTVRLTFAGNNDSNGTAATNRWRLQQQVAAAQTVRYAAAGPHFGAGNELRHSGGRAILATDTLTVNFFDADGNTLDISGLDPPAEVELPLTNMSAVGHVSANNSSNTSNASNDNSEPIAVYCAYWSTLQRKWVTESEGWLVNGSVVVCQTSHFTDFGEREFPCTAVRRYALCIY